LDDDEMPIKTYIHMEGEEIVKLELKIDDVMNKA